MEVCKLRYDAKNKKAQRLDDIMNTQNLSTYNGRSNDGRISHRKRL